MIGLGIAGGAARGVMDAGRAATELRATPMAASTASSRRGASTTASAQEGLAPPAGTMATIPAAGEGASVLKRLGVYTIALTPQDGSVSLRDCADRIRSQRPDRVCLLLGSEGPGLSDAMIRGADLRVSIPIAEGVDSLNASVAGAIAMQRIAEAMGLL